MTIARPQAEGIKQLENERVIVTEWRFAPGAETGWHIHGHDYVVVPLTTGILRLETHDGDKTAQLELGVSYTRSAGVEHNVINANDYFLSFIEVELKP
jgi:beta-alanine degradation protein BauB